ncbi:hypothetical protein [Streptomyces chryseus]
MSSTAIVEQSTAGELACGQRDAAALTAPPSTFSSEPMSTEPHGRTS